MLSGLLKNAYLLTKLIPRNSQVRVLCKNMSMNNSAAYDGDGKTTVRVLNDEVPHLNLINTYASNGFRLANNLFIYGSILVFPTYVYCWNVRRGIDITPESLFVFDLIVPKTKIVIIGYGQHGEPYDASIPMILKKKGISCEMLPTPSAVTTYNYLVSDSVHVAGAFVPVKHEPSLLRKDLADQAHENLYGEHEQLPTGREEDIKDLKDMKKAREYERRHTDPNKKTFDE